MDILKSTVRRVVEGYAGKAHNGHLYLVTSPTEDVFAVIGVVSGERFVTIGLLVRIVDGFVIVEHDRNDKSILDALMQAGIPRDKVILAYAGESMLEAV